MRKSTSSPLEPHSGGPQVIKELLSYLKPNLKPSILIAIHSSDVPNEWMLTDLQEASALPIKTAQNSEFMEPGRIYLCPNGHHLTLSRSRHLYLKPRGSSDRFCPSIDIFFASIGKIPRRQSPGCDPVWARKRCRRGGACP